MTVTPNPVDLAIDQTVQLTVTLRDADGNVLTGRTVTWSSEATSIATVDGSGRSEQAAVGILP